MNYNGEDMVGFDENDEFITLFRKLSKSINDNAMKKGFWEEPNNKAEKIALMHSELSEVLETVRKGSPPSDKIPEISNEVEELADCCIRIMDYCHFYGLDLATAILKKHDYNKTRPYKHGKKF